VPGVPSLQDVINNAVAPLRIKREFIESEGDTMDVEADGNNIEVVGVVQPTFQQLEEGGEDDPLADIRHLYRERLDNAADYTLPKLDNTYNTVRGSAPEDDQVQGTTERHARGGGAQGWSAVSGRRENVV